MSTSLLNPSNQFNSSSNINYLKMVLSSYQTELIDKLRSERVTVDKTID